MEEDIYGWLHSTIKVEEKHLSLYLHINSTSMNALFAFLFVHVIDYLHVKIRVFDFKILYGFLRCI